MRSNLSTNYCLTKVNNALSLCDPETWQCNTIKEHFPWWKDALMLFEALPVPERLVLWKCFTRVFVNSAFFFVGTDSRSENGVAVGFPVPCFLQVLLHADRPRRLKDFVRGGLLSWDKFSAHFSQTEPILFFPLAATLNNSVTERKRKWFEMIKMIKCLCLGGYRSAVDTHSVFEQLEGFFRLFPRWWNCRSSLVEISANGASPGQKTIR